MGRLALVVCVVAAAGCRQLFGIDDTAVEPDAPDADAFVITGPCADDHLVCADFDTPVTGVGQFATALTQAGTLEEQDSVLAFSPPRVLVASVGAGTMLDAAMAQAAVQDELHVSARAWIGISPGSTGCRPLALILYLTSPDPMVQNAVVLQLAPEGYLAILIVDGSTVVTPLASLAVGLRYVVLDLDLATGVLLASVDGTAMQITDPLLAIPGRAIFGVGFGVATPGSGSHGACEVVLDDVIVDRVPATN